MGLPISQVNIALRTAVATRAGFGTPCFISPHKASFSRTLIATGTDSVRGVLSSDSPAYKYVQAVYANTPAPTQVVLGRQDSPSVTLTPETVEAGKVYTVKVTEESGASVTASFTATGSEVPADIVTDIISDLGSLSNISVTGTTDLTIADDTEVCTVTEIQGFTEAYTSTEDASTVLTAVREENDNFFFLEAALADETFMLDMAEEVEALQKLFFVTETDKSYQDTAYSTTETTPIANLVKQNYNNTVVVWSQDEYAGATFVGHNAPYSPDESAVVWDGIELASIPVAVNTDNNALTPTQQANLDSYNFSYVMQTSVGPRILGGKTTSGKWIDEMRTLYCMTARTQEALDTLLLNQKGSKVLGGARGLAAVKAVLIKALTPFVASNALEDFTVSTENASIDLSTRTASNIVIDGILAGAILRVVVNGTLRNNEEV